MARTARTKMTITAHTLVKNEARFVWYAVMSVINYVDKVLLWDTGSTDGTLEILKEIKKSTNKEIDLREVGEVDPIGFTKVRQEMLDSTNTDWFIVVDGDEIWWEESIQKVKEAINEFDSRKLELSDKGKEIESIVVPTINLIGDIYHYQEEAAGQYHLAGKSGHFNLRAVNRSIPGLHSAGPHGKWGWVDGDNRMIQNRSAQKILFVDAPYLHATFLPRTVSREKDLLVPKRVHKFKYELGIPFPSDFYYPEVFFRPRPGIVPFPWIKRSTNYTIRASIETPFKKLKRRLIKGTKVGY
ncbi:MAG: glycosyltransferase [Patescibacteria group bacterium]